MRQLDAILLSSCPDIRSSSWQGILRFCFLVWISVQLCFDWERRTGSLSVDYCLNLLQKVSWWLEQVRIIFVIYTSSNLMTELSHFSGALQRDSSSIMPPHLGRTALTTIPRAVWGELRGEWIICSGRRPLIAQILLSFAVEDLMGQTEFLVTLWASNLSFL